MWAADGLSFVLGTLDKSFGLCSFHAHTDEVHGWRKRHRVQDICGSLDGRWLVAVDEGNSIHVYNAATRELEYDLNLGGARPTSVTMSRDSRHLLVNKQDGETQLVDLVSRNLVQTYHGHVGGNFMIRSTLGGANESFALSGSDDGHFLIWHKASGTVVARIHGHEPRCNAVTWNPTNPRMVASCGDDGTIKM